MRMSKSKLIAALTAVSPGLSKGRETVPQASCFVFRDGLLQTFNDEVHCEVELDLGFTGAVPSKQFAEVLGKLTEDEVDIGVSGKELRIKGKNRRAGIRIEEEVLLPVDDIPLPDDDAMVDIPDADFSGAIAMVATCAGKDDSRFALTCIHITGGFIEACDNYQMMRFWTSLPIEGEYLIRREAAEPLAGLGVERIGATSDWIHFDCQNGLRYTARGYVDDYPQLDKIFAEKAGEKIIFPSGFKEAVERASLFSAERAVDQVRVDMKEGRIRIKGEGTVGWFEEVKKVAYEGPDMSFLIGPELLVKFSERHSEGHVSEKSLRVVSDECVYVTTLEAA